MEIGPVGRQVAENVRRLRKARGWSLQGLADAVESVGHPMRRTGLGKLELAQRRVDVDDLMALALALDVTPNRLLLPAAADDSPVALAEGVTAPALTAWRWAAGDRALPRPDGPFDVGRAWAFQLENRPHDPRSTIEDELTDAQQQTITRLNSAILDALDAGFGTTDLRSQIGVVATTRDAIQRKSGRQTNG